MDSVADKALLFSKTDYGDADLILSFFSLNHGKFSVIAKSAKNSRKRFGGVLELFSLLEVTASRGGKSKGLPVLSEAKIINPYAALRGDFRKMAYAAYFSDLVSHFAEEFAPEPDIFGLMCFSLESLCQNAHTPELISIAFQTKLAQIAGFEPGFKFCGVCGKNVFETGAAAITANISGGGVICQNCAGLNTAQGGFKITAGTLKQLSWMLEHPLDTALRARFNDKALAEGLHFWETFLPYHFGKKIKSLDFLRQIRS